MQEIVLFLSSIAGVCTAVAVKKFPRNKSQLASLGANSNIKNQINSLQIEREILTKTITRLYQNDAGLGKIQRDKLLSRYQYQFGIILAKIDKLEAASKHPDLGPVGEGLITLMDQKLSQLDKSLYELSSKITIANSQIPEKESPKPKQKSKEKVAIEDSLPEKPRPQVSVPTIQVSTPEPVNPVELTTLTEISAKTPQFPFFEPKPTPPKTEIVEEIPKPEQKVPEKIEVIQTTSSIPEIKSETPSQQVTPEFTPPTPQESVPKPAVTLPDEEKIEEDEDDLTKIKGEIIKALSRLEQAEVE
ncbi:MAG: hypothetical protein NPMRTH1_160006 [Nitrosopumilales archaeon]|nr:MAG: hypothetical protein NPMRTH1_160006 [Nitrosopumilales archaeon]